MVKKMKETEIGIIPCDWDVLKLGDYCHIYRGGSPRPIQDYLTTADNGINWIKIGDVKAGDKYITSTEEKIIPEGTSMSREVKAGDFILSNSMSFGRPYILKINGCIHDGWLVIQDYQNSFDANYLYYLLSSEAVFAQYKKLAAGSGVQNLNKDIVTEVILPHPEKKEQIIIAEALSSIDELINVLEKEIEKKKNIKYGVIQKLVVGEERLAGYTGNWVSINMAKKSKLKARIGWQGLTTAEYLDSGYSYLVTGTDFEDGHINWDECHYVTADRYFQDPNIQLTNGDVLITKDGTIGKVALVDGLNKPATLNSGVFVVRPINNAYSARFLYYVLESRVFRDFLDMLSAGSTIVHLYQKDLVNFSFMAPATLEEQEAIASIIYDMDCEIREFEDKLHKYKKIKQGMMNDLLTGKIRLV
ncbi:MAG: restriction endonuclease subunit S [Anaerostipes sp.]|uniref:restriction endonuclease subunit S n=1 Tax=Anaerostipes sp. TaxID=1872530 RepID=UPI0039959BFD